MSEMNGSPEIVSVPQPAAPQESASATIASDKANRRKAKRDRANANGKPRSLLAGGLNGKRNSLSIADLLASSIARQDATDKAIADLTAFITAPAAAQQQPLPAAPVDPSIPRPNETREAYQDRLQIFIGKDVWAERCAQTSAIYYPPASSDDRGDYASGIQPRGNLSPNPAEALVRVDASSTVAPVVPVPLQHYSASGPDTHVERVSVFNANGRTVDTCWPDQHPMVGILNGYVVDRYDETFGVKDKNGKSQPKRIRLTPKSQKLARRAIAGKKIEMRLYVDGTPTGDAVQLVLEDPKTGNVRLALPAKKLPLAIVDSVSGAVIHFEQSSVLYIGAIRADVPLSNRRADLEAQLMPRRAWHVAMKDHAEMALLSGSGTMTMLGDERDDTIDD